MVLNHLSYAFQKCETLYLKALFCEVEKQCMVLLIIYFCAVLNLKPQLLW